MNAAVEVERLLDEYGAVLVRQNKHLVYRLPNGQNFVVAKTSSDPIRAAKNNLSDLRRALGIVRQAAKPGEQAIMPIENSTIVGAPEIAAPVHNSLTRRIETAIARAEQEQETLLAAAQKTERRIQMLRALLPYAEDAVTEEILRAIMPATAAAPRSEPAPEPPQRITERVQVTRQLVLAATQTFDETFTVNDVMTLMTGGGEISREERQRVRSSIAQAIVTLFERGELIREAEGFGKRQAIWRKAVLSGNGHGKGVGTRA